MQDREQLKRTLAEALDVLIGAMRVELSRHGVGTTDVALVQRCRQVMERSLRDSKMQRRPFVSDAELALRRELLEEVLAEKFSKTAS